MLSEFILAVAVRKSITERIWHLPIQLHWSRGCVLVVTEEQVGTSCVLCCVCINLRLRGTRKVCGSVWPQPYSCRGVRPFNCLIETQVAVICKSGSGWLGEGGGGGREGSGMATVLWYDEHIQSVRIKISPLAAWKGEVSSAREKSIRNRSFWRDMCVTVNRS